MASPAVSLSVLWCHKFAVILAVIHKCLMQKTRVIKISNTLFTQNALKFLRIELFIDREKSSILGRLALPTKKIFPDSPK